MDVLDKDGPVTSQETLRKGDKFRNFFGNSRSVSAGSYTASQAVSQQDKPLPLVPDENRILTNIFPENGIKPAIKSTLLGLQDRSRERTNCSIAPICLSGNYLPPSLTAEEPMYNQKGQKWVAEIKEDPIRQDLIKRLVIKMVGAFIAETTQDSIKAAETVVLGPVLQDGSSSLAVNKDPCDNATRIREMSTLYFPIICTT